MPMFLLDFLTCGYCYVIFSV